MSPIELEIERWVKLESIECRKMGLTKRETMKAVKTAMKRLEQLAVKGVEKTYGM